METGLAVIGGGTMGRAIVEGAARAELRLGPVVVAEPDRAKHEPLAAAGAAVVGSPGEALDLIRAAEPTPGVAAILLAVKPQLFAGVASTLRGHLGDDHRLVLSIMAGVTSARIRHALGGHVRVVRLMPNTPAQIGRGVTGLSAGEGALPADCEYAAHVFRSLGDVVPIAEGQMDAFTALAGSGPAYVFYLAEAMVRAGLEAGLDAPTAARVVRGTIAGAAALLSQGEYPPETLRLAVTSKGGTTEAACTVLDEQGVAASIVQAIRAGTARGAALSRAPDGA